ncbi:MAG: methyltransferase domain-containing protein [Gemmatimonadota bacterium]
MTEQAPAALDQPAGGPPFHELEWTPDRVRRFWAWYALSDRTEDYFARQVGGEVLELARRRRVLVPPVLDYGSGPGYLIAHLLAAGLPCAAAEAEAGALEQVRRVAHGSPLLRATYHLDGLPSGIPADEFGTVFLLETLEHLDPDQGRATLAEILRVLRPGGFVVVTTPHAENLARARVACPECGAVFHPVQHVRSFTAESLSAELRAAGFEVPLSQAVTFRPPSPLNGLRRLGAWVLGRTPPNLVALGRKPAEPDREHA